ncbi:MAG: SLC13 family permease [bacterium]|nr:SLC13 family permease [bacterium]
MDLQLLVALSIFSVALVTIILEFLDKSLVAMFGAVLMIILGILNFDEAIGAINFETLGLLIGMMIIVDLVNSSGVFSWVNVNIARLTGGRPWLIFFVFVLVTALFSTFLGNVTTVLVIVPIVMTLTKGLGLNSKLFLVALILFAIAGGAMSLIGDPSNIIIGSAAKLSFNDFIGHQIIPVSAVMTVLLLILALSRWEALRPIAGNLRQLFISHLLIQKIEQVFGRQEISRLLVVKVLFVLFLTLLGFIFQDHLNLPISVISLTGALVLLIATTKHASIRETLEKVEWPTLFFFIGLFIMVAGLEKVGLLEVVGHGIIGITDSYLILLLIVLWTAGFVSMVVDNVPFVTIMIPLIFQIQTSLPADTNSQLLWWALSLGACLGGSGSPIGASANVVSIGLAEKAGVSISLREYLKIGFPMTVLMLMVASLYFVLVV